MVRVSVLLYGWIRKSDSGECPKLLVSPLLKTGPTSQKGQRSNSTADRSLIDAQSQKKEKATKWR